MAELDAAGGVLLVIAAFVLVGVASIVLLAWSLQRQDVRRRGAAGSTWQTWPAEPQQPPAADLAAAERTAAKKTTR